MARSSSSSSAAERPLGRRTSTGCTRSWDDFLSDAHDVAEALNVPLHNKTAVWEAIHHVDGLEVRVEHMLPKAALDGTARTRVTRTTDPHDSALCMNLHCLSVLGRCLCMNLHYTVILAASMFASRNALALLHNC